MVTRPSDLSAPSGEAEIVLSAANLGDAPAGGADDPVALVDTLPPGATALAAYAVTGFPAAKDAVVECQVPNPRTVSCGLEGSLAPYDEIEVRIQVKLEPGGGWSGEPNRFAVSGGGAPSDELERNLSPTGGGLLGFEEFDLRSEEEGGAVGNRAGSHPFQVTAAVSLTQTVEAIPAALPKDLRLRLPPGLLANVSAVSACRLTAFHQDNCPLNSIVGVGIFTLNEPENLGPISLASPIFNVDPGVGEPARFGALPLGVPVLIDTKIRADDYSAVLSIANISELAGFLAATVTLWGTPEDPRHDAARGRDCLLSARGLVEFSCSRLEAPAPRAMLTLPTSCEELAPDSVAEIASWADPLDPAAAVSPFPRLTGCSQVPFQPSAIATSSASSASSPSGLELTLATRGEGLEDPAGLAESAVKGVRVALPEGFTLNPAAGNGLSACGDAEWELETIDGRACPEESKIGRVEVASPIFSQPLNGSIYLGGERGERFDGALTLDVTAPNPTLGILIKLEATLRLDPGTGRITVSTGKLPPLPISSLRLSFGAGPRALLATPPACGASAVVTTFTPFSAPAAAVDSVSPQAITSGAGGGACPGAPPPFDPAFIAGTESNSAGSSSPLYARASRADGEAELAGLSLVLPPGLVADVAGVATCPAAALAAAAARSAGEEEAVPSCPAASRIGRTLVGLGVGPVLSQVPGKLYLAGPYEGAPFSVAAVTPGRLGPLDLGTVVLRFPVDVDPRTGQVSSDFPVGQRLPSILDGVALHLRDLRLYLDRGWFTFNPTSCDPTAIGGFAYAIDGSAAPLSERFQAADCGALGFRPSLSVRVLGSLRRNAHPALRVTIVSNPRQAGIAAAGFALPPGELLDLHHLRGLCPRGAAVAECPAFSRIGRLSLRSPFLDHPVAGPVYLRVPGRGLPALAADLRDGSLHFLLRGQTAAAAGRLRLSFAHLPDIPLTKAVLNLAGGHHGILVNSEDLCGRRLRAEAALSSHSGKVRRLQPSLELGGRC